MDNLFQYDFDQKDSNYIFFKYQKTVQNQQNHYFFMLTREQIKDHVRTQNITPFRIKKLIDDSKYQLDQTDYLLTIQLPEENFKIQLQKLNECPLELKLKNLQLEKELDFYTSRKEDYSLFLEAFRKNQQEEKRRKHYEQPLPVAQWQEENERKFIIDKNLIKYVGQNRRWSQFVFSEEKIVGNNLYQICFDIKQSKYNNIQIGIVDLNQQSNARSSVQSGNAFCLNMQTGCIRYGFNKLRYFNIKLKSKYSVTLYFRLSPFIIRWKIKDQQEYDQIVEPEINLQNRLWKPYIQFFHHGDLIKYSIKK